MDMLNVLTQVERSSILTYFMWVLPALVFTLKIVIHKIFSFRGQPGHIYIYINITVYLKMAKVITRP